MKIPVPANRRRQRGTALLITVIILLFGATILSTYLLLTENEYNTVSRSQTWNTSMTLTEAGVEDALAFMNKYTGQIGMVDQWSSDTSAAQDGWTKSSGVYFTMHRVVGSSGYYDVTIDNTVSNAPVITCTGSAYALSSLSSASSPFLLASAGLTVSSSTIGRSVQVKVLFQALFTDAIDAVTNINLNGNNVRVDSFNSTNPAYSDWTSAGYGTYDSSKARAHGNVGTDSDIVGAISVGQANIYGHVNTGPGGTATVGNNGYVGPLPQVGSGIQTGYANDDMNINFPDVSLPTGASGWQTVPSSGVITNSGNYYLLNLSDNLTISAPNVNLYVAGSITLSGQDAITLTTNVSKVNMYVAGPSISTTGNATINNQTQHASVLAIYGLPSLTSIGFGGNAAYSGTIYAPEADFQFGGGGNNINDFTGAVVVRSVKLNGHSNFHYDESLGVLGPGRGYLPSSWKEIVGN